MKKLIGMIVLGLLLGACTTKEEQKSYISQESAKEYALKEASLEESGIQDYVITLKNDTNVEYYDITFCDEDSDYHYCIDACSGKIIKGTKQYHELTCEKAKQIAINYCGKDIEEALFHESNCVKQDDQYHIEFCVNENNTLQHYSCLINMDNREVEKCDIASNNQCNEHGSLIHHEENHNENTHQEENHQSSTPCEIPTDQIFAIALSRVPGSDLSHITKCDAYQDVSKGTLVYDGQIVYNNCQYDFKIDGYSGEVQTWITHENNTTTEYNEHHQENEHSSHH